MNKRIAIMTGGGDCPGLNAVIRAAVKVGSELYDMEFLGIEDAFHGLVDPSARMPHGNRWLTSADVRNVLARGGTILGTSNRSDPFHYVDPENKSKGEQDVSARVLQNFRDLKLDGLISIGGDGSMKIAQRFFELGMPIVGVPKTIDNDLGATDQTFGFDTAVSIAMEAIDRLRDTAESHDRVMLVEVMGRDAGWIALHAGLASGADAILLPEIPYALPAIANMIRKRSERGQRYSIVVVAEGAKPKDGDVSALEKKPGEMRRLIGAAERVATGLAQIVDADMRVTVLGHVQRGGSPTNFDRILATRFGHAAAELCAKNDYGKMVALRDGNIISITIQDAIAKAKLVDKSSQLVQTARATGVVFGDE